VNKRYKIYVGSEQIEQIHRAFDVYFDCYTVIKSMSVWRGSIEQSYIVEIIGKEKDYNTIFTICKQLKVTLKQESILMTDEHVHAQMI